MRLTTNIQPLVDRLTTAGRAATNDTAEEIRRNQARVTGRLAAGTKVVVSPRTGQWAIANDVVYADAVERGANARQKASVKAGTKRRRGQCGPVFNRASRRGPHMAGNHIVADHGPSFLEHMPRRLREASR